MYSQEAVKTILKKVSTGKLSSKKAFEKLRHLSYETLSFARVDHHRWLRKRMPEVVYGGGKSEEQLAALSRALLKKGAPFLITRLDEKVFRKLKRRFPKLSYSRTARMVYRKFNRSVTSKGCVALVTAGTSDLAVAEEAAVTLEVMGKSVKRFYDCGVAGLHRLLDQVRDIQNADVVICVAGMEGALPSVLAGLISKPVVAVPTSVGYGANFKGIAPLLTMLNSCSQGVAVVNINSGFNAACFALLILNLNR
ncbi:MAG: 1-(5-phosphoribosyl)-5-amino-4-imidazole-carboxylate carboxylase [Omnitrophica bacterium RIFCSPLOWO2_01_FULL_50_24]|nr:MAG: 1-(5-phosphoribosyl)-5-amino-4-imidazole-carboxylate carboxylase [Omnitrophica bacterium RIFCSPLOWO2_01_FULL_50_24]